MEFVVRYREIPAGQENLFLMDENGKVMTFARADEALAEGHRRLDGGPAVEITAWLVTQDIPAGIAGKKPKK